MAETLTVTRVKNDVNGNSRYVVHFLALNTQAELDADPWISVSEKYAIALKRARKIGGRKFHNRQYGGGIVFQCYSVQELAKDIGELTCRIFTVSED